MLYYVENEDTVVVQVNKNEKTKFDMDKIVGEMTEEVVFFSNGMGMNTPVFKKMRETRCDKIEYRFNWCSEDNLNKDIEEIEDRLYHRLRSFAMKFDNKSSAKFNWIIKCNKINSVSLIVDFK